MSKLLTIETLIAPCGMDCGVCLGYLREKNKCSGCNSTDNNKPPYCFKCIIKNCSLRKTSFCYDCEKYPCRRLKQLDKRYTLRYKTSLIENLERIKELGIDKFISTENKKWKCHECGGTICIHRGYCLKCHDTKKGR